MSRRRAFLFGLTIAAGCVAAATIAGRPHPGGTADSPAGRQLLDRLARARGGETIALPPGDYGQITFPRGLYHPAITLDAAAARFTGIVIADSGGIVIRGGTVVGPGGRSYGIIVRNGERIAIEGMRITGAHRGIVVGNSRKVRLEGNQLTQLIAEGINIALSREIVVRRNRCEDFSPRITTYSADGRRLVEGDHPDCIQGWSRPKAPPVADLLIEDNVARGRMQGIFLGNHTRNGINDGGFDRIVIRNNVVESMYSNAIALIDARDSRVTGNSVVTLPGAVNPKRPLARIRANLRVTGTNNVVCGNRVRDFPDHPTARPC